ncbi:unnamed protein product [Closterium sp. NIES-54]
MYRASVTWYVDSMKCHARWPASKYSLHDFKAICVPGEQHREMTVKLGFDGFLPGEDIRLTSDVALRGACSLRRPHSSRLNAADFIGVNHSSVPRRASRTTADLTTTGVDARVDAALSVHRSRRDRPRRVLRRPHGTDASLDDRPRQVAILIRLVTSPRVLQPCLQGVHHPCVNYSAYHSDYRTSASLRTQIRSAALLTSNPEVGSAQARTGPTTTPVDTTATTPTAATTATPTAATTAAATHATTLATATTSTAAPTTTPAATATTPTTLALAAAVLPTSRSNSDVLSTKDVNSSSRGVGGGKGGGGTPLKEGRARTATSGTYSDYTSLSCKEVLLE